jgi:hypothetical protein
LALVEKIPLQLCQAPEAELFDQLPGTLQVPPQCSLCDAKGQDFTPEFLKLRIVPLGRL